MGGISLCVMPIVGGADDAVAAGSDRLRVGRRWIDLGALADVRAEEVLGAIVLTDDKGRKVKTGFSELNENDEVYPIVWDAVFRAVCHNGATVNEHAVATFDLADRLVLEGTVEVGEPVTAETLQSEVRIRRQYGLTFDGLRALGALDIAGRCAGYDGGPFRGHGLVVGGQGVRLWA